MGFIMEKITKFYNKYEKELKREIYRRTGDYLRTEDILHNIFIHVMLHIHWWDSQNDEICRAYIFSLIDMYCRKDRSGITWEYEEELLKGIGAGDYTDRICERIDVLRLVKSLKERDRSMILLYYYEHKSLKEIAFLFGQSVDTVNHWLMRGRRRLGVLMRESGFVEK